MRKRSYLLFELLLAFFLLAFLLFPMLKTHFLVVHKDIERIEKMQCEILKDKAFASLSQKLYENKEFSFKALKKGVQGSLENEFFLITSKDKVKKMEVFYELKPLESCKRRKGVHENYLLLEAKISFKAPHRKKGHDYKTTFLLREYE